MSLILYSERKDVGGLFPRAREWRTLTVTPSNILTNLGPFSGYENADAEDVIILTEIILEHDVGPGLHQNQYAIRCEKAGKLESRSVSELFEPTRKFGTN